tara:strand:+ start:372 stop:638 length:267 start_codon:yes stop_codon:yes gene_type:complete
MSILQYNLKDSLRKVKSQKYGWVIIDQSDRDWDSGKPLETKDLQNLTKLLSKFALKDILDDPYILKLYREFDKLVVMKQPFVNKGVSR